jgi:hypothetical protein
MAVAEIYPKLDRGRAQPLKPAERDQPARATVRAGQARRNQTALTVARAHC